MATFHTLGIADPPLELHVLDVLGAHCLTVFSKGNVAASRKQVAPALVTFFEKVGRERVVGRPLNTILWIGSEAEFQRYGQRWNSSQQHIHSVSAHLRASAERGSLFPFFVLAMEAHEGPNTSRQSRESHGELWGMSPFEVSESFIGRPKDTSSWTGSESECRDAVCDGVLRNYTSSSSFFRCSKGQS